MALLAKHEALQAERDVAVADAANVRSERTARLIDQLELQLEDLVTAAPYASGADEERDIFSRKLRGRMSVHTSLT